MPLWIVTVEGAVVGVEPVGVDEVGQLVAAAVIISEAQLSAALLMLLLLLVLELLLVELVELLYIDSCRFTCQCCPDMYYTVRGHAFAKSTVSQQNIACGNQPLCCRMAAKSQLRKGISNDRPCGSLRKSEKFLTIPAA